MIYRNTKQLENLHIGDKEIHRVFFEDKLVWENNQIIDLGSGTSFNLTRFSNYQNFTLDNFFISSAIKTTVTGRLNSGVEDFYDQLVKSYNSQTGVLTCYLYSDATTDMRGNVHVYLVTKPSKLTYLGNKQSFNVSNISGYQNFTVDNFLIKSANDGNKAHVGAIRDPLDYTQTVEIVKSYNASTGVLTCYMYGTFTTGKSHSENWYAERKDNVQVYLTKR